MAASAKGGLVEISGVKRVYGRFVGLRCGFWRDGFVSRHCPAIILEEWGNFAANTDNIYFFMEFRVFS